MSISMKFNRRGALKAGVAAAATLAAPGYIKRAWADGPIRIGLPAALTGSFSLLGQQVKRGAEFFVNETNAKGGLLGRQLELLPADTTGNPANCVRKARELIERDNCRLMTGIVTSSEALAVVPSLQQWNALFMSSVPGDGSLTSDKFVPNFFRANMSGPMSTRTVSLGIGASKMKTLYLIGMDYAWGHDTAKVFEQQMKSLGKDYAGVVFSPIGTKDFSTYIVKIRQSGADGLMVALAGDDLNAFLAQAGQYQLNNKMTLMMEQVVVESLKVVGKGAIGITGCSRYAVDYDHPNNKAFVTGFQKAYGSIPDMFEGESYHAMEALAAGITKANSIETEPVRKALENLEFEGVKGKVVMRACDHQAEQQGFLTRLQTRGSQELYPGIENVFDAERVTPICKTSSYPT